jgi:LytS/YehU family sensor histidine kinase
MDSRRAHRFWLWYAAAWLLQIAAYFFAFYMQGRTTAAMTAIAAFASVLPDAGLGIAVVHICRRLWSRTGRRRAGRLVALALAFIAAAAIAKALLSVLIVRLDGGSVTLATLDRSILLWQAFFSLLAFAVLTSVTFGVAAAAHLREAEARRSQAELLRVRSDLKVLRAQLNPHFLFNTLHSVRALIGENPAAAEDAIEHLGDLLRHALRVQDADEDGVLLAEEWEFVRVYLALEQLRLGDRLRVDADVADAALQVVVPAFVLQPLVENAIQHGIAPRVQGGAVRIDVVLDGGVLCLRVGNDVPDGVPSSKGLGKGLELVRQRLGALYGDAASVEVANSTAGFAVTVRLPAAMESR